MSATVPLFSDNRAGITALPLSDLLGYIQGTLKNAFRDSFWIIAEVTNVSRSSGHYYFDLAEMKNGQVVAKCRANLWSFVAQRVIPYFQQVTGDQPRVGMELMLQVKVEFHLQYGFSLNILNINPDHTLGNLERQKQETIRRLQTEGVFDLNKRYQLPRLVQRIAVISSETAAGWGDFSDQIHKSVMAPLFRIDLYPSLMQGNGTTRSIYEALLRIQARITEYDAVVILRGGGSRMDLSAFDDYNLCVLIANFPMPIITAIGHERDTSVADMVANTSVKTPTAAAEFILRRIETEVVRSLSFEQRITTKLNNLLRDKEQQYTSLAGRLRQALITSERIQTQRLNRYAQNTVSILTSTYAAKQNTLSPIGVHLRSILTNVLSTEKRRKEMTYSRITQLLRQATMRKGQELMKAENMQSRLSLLLQRIVPEAKKNLDRYEQLIKVYDPTHIMSRGFLPVVHKGKQVSDINAIEEKDELRILFVDGELSASVTHIDKTLPNNTKL